jgi:hypothetical protein
MVKSLYEPLKIALIEVSGFKLFKAFFIAGLVILTIGIAIAVIPFREEIVPTENMIQISDWNVSWYYIPLEPTEEGFAGSALGGSTFQPVFRKDWGTEGVYGEFQTNVPAGFQSNIGFIAVAEMDMPVDGYVYFEIASGDGARLYIDDDLVIDIWETRTHWQDIGVGSKTVRVEAGKHRLELWWYQWTGWAYASFYTDRKVMVLERRSDPIVGLGIACVGAVFVAVARLKASKKRVKP